jgi:hypothetical protein
MTMKPSTEGIVAGALVIMAFAVGLSACSKSTTTTTGGSQGSGMGTMGTAAGTAAISDTFPHRDTMPIPPDTTRPR